MLSTSNRPVTERVKIFSYTNITKANRCTLNERFSRFTTDQSSSRFTANTAKNSFTNTDITTVKRLAHKRKNNMFITAHNTRRFIKSFSSNRFIPEIII